LSSFCESILNREYTHLSRKRYRHDWSLIKPLQWDLCTDYIYKNKTSSKTDIFSLFTRKLLRGDKWCRDESFIFCLI
jgi:hypothetical protein